MHKIKNTQIPMKKLLSLFLLCVCLSSCEEKYQNPNRCVEVPCPSSFSAKVKTAAYQLTYTPDATGGGATLR